MKRNLIAAAAAAALMTLAAAPVSAQELLDFEKTWLMADRNKDGAVTKQEFMEAMGRVYDMKMSTMKTGKDASKMIKGDAMTRDALKSLFEELYRGA